MDMESDISNEDIGEIEDDTLLIVPEEELDGDDYEDFPLFDVVDESSAILLSVDSPICCLDIDPLRKRRVLFGGCDDRAYLSDIPENPIETVQGACKTKIGIRRVLEGHSDTVSCASYSVDGRFFATSGCDGTVRVYGNEDSNEGRLICALEGPSDELEFIRWHPRGPCILAGGVDGMGWLWMIPEGKVVSVLSGHGNSITCGDFSNDGKQACTGSLDGSVIIWNPKSGESLHRIQRSSFMEMRGIGEEESSSFEDPGVVSMRSHARNPLLAVGLTDGAFSLIHSESGKVLSLRRRHTDSLECLEFINNIEDPLLATGDMAGELIIWNFEYNRECFVMKNYELEHSNGVLPGITSISWGGDGSNKLVAVGCLDGTIRIWDYRTGMHIKTLRGHQSGILSMKILDFGFKDTHILRLVSTGDDGKCLLWDVRM